MLKRVLEPEVMDTPEEAMAYDDMDHAEVNQRFVEDLLAAGSLEGEVLDLGTGTARIPLLLCDRSEEVRVMAVDLSSGMLDVARINIELSPHLERVMLDRIDAKELPYEDDRFAAVISNSIVHHIPDPALTFAESVRVCADGLLFFRDLKRPNSTEELQQLVEIHAGEESDHARQLFRDSLQAAFTSDEIRAYLAVLGFAPETVHTSSDRHWTWTARKPAG